MLYTLLVNVLYVLSTIYTVWEIFLKLLVCSNYNASIRNNKPPHLVIDTTINGVTSETVKSFTAALALPTISASYGQDGDIR